MTISAKKTRNIRYQIFVALSNLTGFLCPASNIVIKILEAYGFLYSSLKYFKTYLDKGKRKVNINNNFSSRETILKRVPECSILGPLLFDIFIYYLFFSVTNSQLSNYVDNNTVHSYHKTVNEVNEKLKLDFKLVITWFHENRMLVNPGKCHYMCLDSKTEKAEFSFGGKTFEKSKEETVSDVTVDKKLTFYNHIKGLCQKAFHEISALS